MRTQERQLGAQDAGIDVLVVALDTGEGLQGPAAADPPRAAVAVEEVPDVLGGARRPISVQTRELGLFHPLTVSEAARVSAAWPMMEG